MALPAAIYRDGNRTFLAIYNHWPDIYVATPHSIKDSARRVGHLSYGWGHHRRGIDFFQLSSRDLKIPEVNIGKTIYYSAVEAEISKVRGIDRKHDIQSDLIKIPNIRRFQNLSRFDIFTFCLQRGGIAAKNPQGPRKTYHKRIIPRTQVRKINYSSEKGILAPGKPDFVEECILEANIDFSKGCLSGWIPSEGASFDGQEFVGFYFDPSAECPYCYALSKHKSFPKTIYRIDYDRLLEELKGNCKLIVGKDTIHGKLVEFLRFGKRTETGSKYTREQFALTLEACIETGTIGIIPTKYLEFDEHIAKLLIKSNSVLLYSIGNDRWERGACAHGCNNEFRLEQAIRYRQAGANSNLYVLIDAQKEMADEQRILIEKALRRGVFVQLLARKYGSKILVHEMTGVEWEHYTRPPEKTDDYELLDLFGEVPHAEFTGTYKAESGVLNPITVHPSWLKLIGNNNGKIRMCHHHSTEQHGIDRTYCGKCFVDDGLICEGERPELEKLPVRADTYRREKKFGQREFLDKNGDPKKH